MTQTIDFAKYGVTGSERYKPATVAANAERRRKARHHARELRKANIGKERARWRKVAAKRRKENAEALKAANRQYYRQNRAKILAQKGKYYCRKAASRRRDG